MCETRWDPQHMLVFASERLPQPAPERSRAAAKVNGDIKNFSQHSPDQLALRMTKLIMQATQHISARQRVFILDKFIHNSQFCPGLFVVAFQKKPKAVREYSGLDPTH